MRRFTPLIVAEVSYSSKFKMSETKGKKSHMVEIMLREKCSGRMWGFQLWIYTVFTPS